MILHKLISRRDDTAVLVKSRLQRTTATPSSGHRVDGVDVDAMNQHEGAVKFEFHTGLNPAHRERRSGSNSSM